MERRVLTRGGDSGPSVEAALHLLGTAPGVEVIGSTTTSILIEADPETVARIGPLLPGWTDSPVQNVARPRTWPRL